VSFYLLLLITTFGIFKLLVIVLSVLLFTTSDYHLWHLQTFGHCIVCPSIYYFWLPPLVSSNLHKPNSDCPAFLFRQDPVFSQISISYKKCRQCKHVMLSELRRTITYGIGWLLCDWNNGILLRKNQHERIHKIWFDFDFWCFNATFNSISAISWRPVLVVEEAGVPGENHRSWASNW
jgi:hypothetical protein